MADRGFNATTDAKGHFFHYGQRPERMGRSRRGLYSYKKTRQDLGWATQPRQAAPTQTLSALSVMTNPTANWTTTRPTAAGPHAFFRASTTNPDGYCALMPRK